MSETAPSGGAPREGTGVHDTVPHIDLVTAMVLLDSLEPHWAATLLCVEWGWDRAFTVLSQVEHEAAQEAMFTAIEWLVVEHRSLV